MRGHPEPFAVILRSVATKDLLSLLRAGSAKDLLFRRRLIRQKAYRMAKLFWVTCPACTGRFCAHSEELRHNKKFQLLCPYCGKRFFDEESPHIED